MVTALNVANNILRRGFSENIDITPMKLQKLIYFVYREYLKKTGKSLFNERFETWKYGPVILSVYHTFKKNGSNAIRNYGFENGEDFYFLINEKASPAFKEALDDVWDKYKHYNGIVLSSITHAEGSAWRKAYETKNPYLLDEDIRKEEIISV